VRAESAFDRHRRILAVATGLGTVIFALLAWPAIVEQAPALVPAVYVPLTALFCGLPILLIPLGAWAPLGWVVGVARTHTVVAVLILVTWVPSMTAAGLPHDHAPWVLNTLAVAAATSVLAWPAAVTWSYVAALAVGGSLLRYVVLGTGDVGIPLEDGISMLGFSLIISAILIVTLRAGSAQDEALAAALGEARAAAEVSSRARQRARFGSLVHDEVITTLIAATRSSGSSPAVAESAARAVRRLDEFVVDSSDSQEFAPATLAVQLRSSATSYATGIRFSGDLDTFEGTIPAPVALAMTGALAEAVRNSVRHGGAKPIHRRVTFAATADSVTVVLSDDGAGFDVRRVAPERLGIRASIVGRMTAAGGRADLASSPDKGTTVTLSWAAAG